MAAVGIFDVGRSFATPMHRGWQVGPQTKMPGAELIVILNFFSNVKELHGAHHTLEVYSVRLGWNQPVRSNDSAAYLSVEPAEGSS